MTRKLGSLLLGFFLVGLAAQTPASPGNNADSGAEFSGVFPAVSGKGALTVSGKGYHHREVYEEGDVPTLSAFDDADEPLPDGIYRFQFTSTPQGAGRSTTQRDMLRDKSSSSGGDGSAMPSHLTGSFEVMSGNLIFH